MNFYKEELIDHYKNPRNYGKLSNPNISSGEYNPSCGDMVEMQGIIDNNILLKLYFTGKGCVISQAISSMLTQTCAGKSIAELLSLKDEDILSMVGFALGPNRAKCALLPFYALHNGLLQYSS